MNNPAEQIIQDNKVFRKTIKIAGNTFYKGTLKWIIPATLIPGIIAAITVVLLTIYLHASLKGAVQQVYDMSDLSFQAYLANMLFGGPKAFIYSLADPALFSILMMPLLIAILSLFVITTFIINPVIACVKGLTVQFSIIMDTKGEVSFSDIKPMLGTYFKRYLNVVMCLLLRSLIVFASSLLLIIPGIIKAYQYMAVPYLLFDNPEISWREILKKSSSMMYGRQKCAFKLDISFIGWYILGEITCGILTVLFVVPYHLMTRAVFFCFLARAEDSDSEEGQAPEDIKPVFPKEAPMNKKDDTILLNEQDESKQNNKYTEENNSTPESVSMDEEQGATLLGRWEAVKALVNDVSRDPSDVLGKEMTFTIYPENKMELTYGGKTKTCSWNIPKEGQLQMHGLQNFIFTITEEYLILGFEQANIYFQKTN